MVFDMWLVKKIKKYVNSRWTKGGGKKNGKIYRSEDRENKGNPSVTMAWGEAVQVIGWRKDLW